MGFASQNCPVLAFRPRMAAREGAGERSRAHRAAGARSSPGQRCGGRCSAILLVPLLLALVAWFELSRCAWAGEAHRCALREGRSAVRGLGARSQGRKGHATLCRARVARVVPLGSTPGAHAVSSPTPLSPQPHGAMLRQGDRQGDQGRGKRETEDRGKRGQGGSGAGVRYCHGRATKLLSLVPCATPRLTALHNSILLRGWKSLWLAPLMPLQSHEGTPS